MFDGLLRYLYDNDYISLFICPQINKGLIDLSKHNHTLYPFNVTWKGDLLHFVASTSSITVANHESLQLQNSSIIISGRFTNKNGYYIDKHNGAGVEYYAIQFGNVLYVRSGATTSSLATTLNEYKCWGLTLQNGQKPKCYFDGRYYGEYNIAITYTVGPADLTIGNYYGAGFNIKDNVRSVLILKDYLLTEAEHNILALELSSINGFYPQMWNDDREYKTSYGAKQTFSNITSGYVDNSIFTINSGSIAITSEEKDEAKVKTIVATGVSELQATYQALKHTKEELAYATIELTLYKTNLTDISGYTLEDALGNTYSLQWYSDDSIIFFIGGVPEWTSVGTYAHDNWLKLKWTRSAGGVFMFYVNDLYVGTYTDNNYTEIDYFKLLLGNTNKLLYSDFYTKTSLNIL